MRRYRHKHRVQNKRKRSYSLATTCTTCSLFLTRVVPCHRARAPMAQSRRPVPSPSPSPSPSQRRSRQFIRLGGAGVRHALTVFTTRPIAWRRLRLGSRRARAHAALGRAPPPRQGSDASVSATAKRLVRAPSASSVAGVFERAPRGASRALARAALRASLCALASLRLCPGPPRCPPCTLPPWRPLTRPGSGRPTAASWQYNPSALNRSRRRRRPVCPHPPRRTLAARSAISSAARGDRRGCVGTHASRNAESAPPNTHVAFARRDLGAGRRQKTRDGAPERGRRERTRLGRDAHERELARVGARRWAGQRRRSWWVTRIRLHSSSRAKERRPARRRAGADWNGGSAVSEPDAPRRASRAANASSSVGADEPPARGNNARRGAPREARGRRGDAARGGGEVRARQRVTHHRGRAGEANDRPRREGGRGDRGWARRRAGSARRETDPGTRISRAEADGGEPHAASCALESRER